MSRQGSFANDGSSSQRRWSSIAEPYYLDNTSDDIADFSTNLLATPLERPDLMHTMSPPEVDSQIPLSSTPVQLDANLAEFSVHMRRPSFNLEAFTEHARESLRVLQEGSIIDSSGPMHLDSDYISGITEKPRLPLNMSHAIQPSERPKPVESTSLLKDLKSDAAVSKCNETAKPNTATGDAHITPSEVHSPPDVGTHGVKRKCNAASPVTGVDLPESKRRCSEMKAKKTPLQSRNQSLYLLTGNIPGSRGGSASTRTMSDCELLGLGRDTRRNPAWAWPWGVQRALVLQKVEDRAQSIGVPVPPLSDEVVHKFSISVKDAPFHPIYSTLPVENIDIRVLGNIEVTAEELLTFFPRHLRWGEVSFRLWLNGWSNCDTASYINYTREFVAPNMLAATQTKNWRSRASKDMLPPSGISRQSLPWKTTSFIMKGMNLRAYDKWVKESIDYYLVDLADGVKHFPEGEGARLLTRAIQHAVRHKNLDAKLSQIHQYIREYLLIFPLLPSLVGKLKSGKHPDVLSLERARIRMQDAGWRIQKKTSK